MRPCKDCGSTTRKVTPPGPRCATCHRAAKAARKGASHELYVLKTYGLRAGQYQALYEAQGGVCYICQRAKGLTKKLAVDHDHETGYVRGLLCGPCNRMLGHLRESFSMIDRTAYYLADPPAFDVIGKVKPDGP
jgi:hypothetical protein